MTGVPFDTAYDVLGPKDAPVVVLIHGLGLNREVWDQTIGDLAQDFRVLTYDMLGHGRTPSPLQKPDLTLLARQLAQLLAHLQVRAAALVGFSLGGMVARRFAQDYPDRCLALALLHSPHRRTPEAQAAILARVAQAKGDGPAATVEAALVRWFSDDYRKANPQVMDQVRGWVLANNPATYPLFYDVLASGIEEIVAPHPPLSCPTLVITGDEDHGNGPEMAHAIAAEIAGAQTMILHGLRHMALMEAPERTNAPLSAFLKKVLIHG
jgi:pimeloyl-ACP methyl ester carboxylesterase